MSNGRLLGKLLGSSGSVPTEKLAGNITIEKLAGDIPITEKFTTASLLPSSGTIGEQAFVEETNRLYIWNGSGWYNIALINTTPTWDSNGQPAATYTLDADSPQTATTITLAASDPEGIPISYNYVTGGSMDSIATISQDSSVFTITPKTEAQVPNGGTGTITFRATDGINILPQVSSFTLTFPVDWSSITQQAALKASDAGANDKFGTSVATAKDGSTAIVGARLCTDPTLYEGAAYIFTRSGTTWSQQAKIQQSDRHINARFGASVSISEDGNTAIVGAELADALPQAASAGAAYIFTRSGTTWSQQAKIQQSDRHINARFGASVSISEDGNTAIVGAELADALPQAASAGAAYIFTRSGTTWSQQAKLIASDGSDSYYFGSSVSITDDGNTAIIGARLDGGTNFGAAYVFTRSGTTWSQQTKLTASDAQTDDEFGYSVSISGSDGNTAIVSSPKEDAGGTSNSGAAYIFTRSGTTWSQQAKIQASNKGSNDLFGYGLNAASISGDGNTVVVGAVNEDTSGTDAGAAYVFTRSGTTWSQQAMIKASDAAASDKFGYSVSISDDGDTITVGAFNESGTGAAYIFIRSGASWSQVNKIQASNAQSGDEFGNSISISNKSVIVGAPEEDTTASGSGSAYIFG